jgi:integrase
MGTFKTRKNQEGKITYYAEVRRKGAAAFYKSFSRLTDARAWIHDTESDIRNGRAVSVPTQRHTLPEAIKRYFLEVPCENERKDLLEATKKSPSANLYPLVILALSTGMRRSEVLKLRWNQVDLQQGCIILTKTKNKTSRRVPIL